MDSADARTLNNLGVVKWAQGEANKAKDYFDDALKADPDHAAATFNTSLLQNNGDRATALVDRSGAAGTLEDKGGKVELASAVRFASRQQLEVHRHGKWELMDAGSLGMPLVELTYRLPDAPKYVPEQLLLIYDGEWQCTQARRHSTPLKPTDHAPALFADLTTMSRAQQAYAVECKEKHAFILDLFSGQRLNTRTQTAMLHLHRESAQVLSKDQDIDAENWQSGRKASVMDRGDTVKATRVLHEMLGGDDRAVVRLRHYLLLVLGPAASGKTTLLKTFTMEVVHCYTDFVPVLMPVIDVVPVLTTCNRDEGKSVVAAFIQSKYPQHAHLLLQLMLMRRAVFLVDGIDESGMHQKDVQDFITIELLEPGHKTVITSRHSGFSSDAFKQCRLVELLPLSTEQQTQMVHTRVLDDRKATRLVMELGTTAFKDIASNPLMLTMMVSVYVNNGCKLISSRSEVYEKALRTIVGRTDKGRAGIDQASQAVLFEQLQKLAAGSHGREGDRRIFTAAAARQWAGLEGWSAIQEAMRQGRLPIIVALGPNDKDEATFRFGHMSYQEYLTGREYYQKLTASHFSTDAMVELFGQTPQHAFAKTKQHLMLQLLAGILSPDQRVVCLAAMAGGCVEAAEAPAEAIIDGGDVLTITKQLSRAGAEALAPYLRENTHLKMLVLPKTKLGADGMRALADALKTNSTLTALDVSENDLGVNGAKAVADMLHSNNDIGALVLPEGWEYDKSASSWNSRKWIYKHADGREQKAHPGKPEGAIAIANAISANGALEKLLMAENYMATKEAGKALADALATNSTLKELDVSSNAQRGYGLDGPGFAKALAVGVKNNGALAKLTFGGDSYEVEDGYDVNYQTKYKTVTPESAVLEVGMTEADLSGKNLGAGGAIITAAWISNKDNGALTSLNISANNLGRYYDNSIDEWISDMTGIKAIAAAIPQCK
eukprot:g1879.t1